MRIQWNHLVFIGAGVVALATGCGGNASATVGVDGGADAPAATDSGHRDTGSHDAAKDAPNHDVTTRTPDGSTLDTGLPDAAPDSPPARDASDAGPPCTTDQDCQSNPADGPNTICDVATGACVSSACTTTKDAGSACVNPADFCCAKGCVPGDCCSNADCVGNAAGLTCGATAANQCGSCTEDSECPAYYICNTTTGGCVSNSESFCVGTLPNGGAPSACSVSTNDLCCANPGDCLPSPPAGAIPCCSGSDADSYCQTMLGGTAVCDTTANICTTCGPIDDVSPVYYVDPVNGSDTAGTGSGLTIGNAAAADCALKTITRALAIIGAANEATQIVVIGAAGGVGLAAGETYPITLPEKVSLTTESGPVTVTVPDKVPGFVLSAANTSLSGALTAPLTITTTVSVTGTTVTGGTNGIQVLAGASSTTTQISNLTVTGMAKEGIHVGAGGVAIGPGVVSTLNGVAGTPALARQGLHVTGSGTAVIAVSAGQPATQFNANTAHGILVDEGGSVQISGVVTDATTGTGTVETNGNAIAGLWIEQTPGTPPTNTVTGLVSFGATAGNGVRVFGGSSLVLTQSALLGNAGNGIAIGTYVSGTTRNDSLALIDLGDATTSGGNTLQAASPVSNAGVGICLDVAANTGALSAVGNTFQGAVCATAATALQLDATGCASTAACTGGICDLGFKSAAEAVGNSFDVSECTQ
jgi:hypothetical protein